MLKPYAVLPDYADVAYVDGKLKVASGIIHRSSDRDLCARWMVTVDQLLDQRLALVAVSEAA